MGRLFSANKANLIGFRPSDADASIKNDFPNETGSPNHSDGAPGCTGNNCPDNHDTLTGSDAMGQLYTTGESDLQRLDEHRRQRGQAARRALLAANAVQHEHLHRRAAPMGGGGSSGAPTAATATGCRRSTKPDARPGSTCWRWVRPNPSNPTVGSGGGYGGFYCFALTP